MILKNSENLLQPVLSIVLDIRSMFVYSKISKTEIISPDILNVLFSLDRYYKIYSLDTGDEVSFLSKLKNTVFGEKQEPNPIYYGEIIKISPNMWESYLEELQAPLLYYKNPTQSISSRFLIHLTLDTKAIIYNLNSYFVGRGRESVEVKKNITVRDRTRINKFTGKFND